MNKLFSVFTALSAIAFSSTAYAQEMDSIQNKRQEIIIRKDGGKETSINIQIDGEEVMINGKPLMDFNEDGVTIMKRKMRIHDGKPGMQFRRRFKPDGMNEDGMTRTITETVDSTTFLGVTTEYNKKGAEIMAVSQGSAADKAGLMIGDIITQINKEKISSPEDLSNVIQAKSPKEKVTISYIRDGKEKKLDAELQLKKKVTRKTMFITDLQSQSEGMPFSNGRRPFPPPPPPFVDGEGEMIMENIAGDEFNMNNMDIQVQVSKKPKIGLKIRDINEGNGVEVLEVTENSVSAAAGIQKMDIITGIGGNEVNNTDEARELLKMAEQASSFNVDLLRNGKKMSLKVSTPKKIKTADL
jgi:serine protease Do